MNKYLNEQEHRAYFEDFAPIAVETIGKIVQLADKHNVDRDNAMEHFVTIFGAMVEISSFEHYEVGKEQDDGQNQ